MSSVNTYGFYNRLLRIPILYLYCATLLFVILCTGFWWIFLYQPAALVIQSSQQEIDQKHLQIAQLRKTERSLLGISKSIDAVKQNVHKQPEIQSHKSNAQQSLALIAEYATNSGIQVEACRSCGYRKETWCDVTDVSGDFKGSFDQMITFFDVLKSSKQIIDVSKCDLIHIDGDMFSLRAIFSLYCA